ncbi:MAG: hypothetical protein KBG48_01780 [Kofleriaceae bacterium]|nr:hypothetical protein [Kofleriaceae bacterium]MBP9166077.1 hypothetical protein [Kofleriaceae bacterium]MBP9856907.1 hypothetical protein [Kofleriaceae bacterium]
MKTLDGAIAVVVIAVFGSGAHLAVADDALPAGGPAASATSEPAPESASEPVPGAPVISTDGPPATASAAMESVRYSTWTLVADGASLALVIGGGAVGNGVVMSVGFAGGALGAPVIHVARGNFGRAAISAALRQGLFWGGVLIGAQVSDGDCGDSDGDFAICTDGLAGALVGGLLGYGAAAVIDAAALAVERRPARSASAALAVHPRISITGERVQLGLAGQF